MTSWPGFLTLAFVLLWSPGVTSLPSLVPTRTVQLRRTNVLTARASSSSATAAPEAPLSKPAQAAVSVVTVLLFAGMFGFLIAKKCGVQFHCNRAKKALGRRSRGHNIPPPSPPPTVVPMAEHHRPPVADNNPSYGKLDGWTPPPAPKEAPHKTIDVASYTAKGSLLLGILPGQNHATIENWTFAMVSKLKLGGAGQIVEFKYLVRAALLRHFARANKDLLQTEDAIDLDGAATTGVTDEGDFESGEPMNPGTSGGSSKRKSRKENGQPAAKKPRGGQGKQPVGAHFFASLDKWLEGLYAKNGTDMNSDAWRNTVNEYLLEDYQLHGHVHHWAFPDSSTPPPPAAASTYQPPQGIYGNLQS